MKIGIIAATGQAGNLITREALKRGHETTAIVRNKSKAADLEELGARVLEKDIFDLTRKDLKEFEVVIDAFGTTAEGTFDLYSQTTAHLTELLNGLATRLLIVGGAASLYTDRTHTAQLIDTPDFPEFLKPLAKGMAKSLDELREAENANWTFVSPAADFRLDGPRTGTYQLAGEELAVSSKGESQVSYADYAIAMLDLAESGEHNQERVSVVAK